MSSSSGTYVLLKRKVEMKKNSNLRRIEQTFACRIAREKQNLFVTTLVAQEIENEDFELIC